MTTTRRSFLSSLSALPFLGWVRPKPTIAPETVELWMDRIAEKSSAIERVDAFCEKHGLPVAEGFPRAKRYGLRHIIYLPEVSCFRVWQRFVFPSGGSTGFLCEVPKFAIFKEST